MLRFPLAFACLNYAFPIKAQTRLSAQLGGRPPRLPDQTRQELPQRLGCLPDLRVLDETPQRVATASQPFR
jgi:hypothetical protein